MNTTVANPSSGNTPGAAFRRDLSLVLPELRDVSETPGVEGRIEGKPASVNDALASARDLLRGSVAPAILGLNGLSIEAAREAVALAEKLRAKLLPTPMPDPVAAAMTVMQTATLGHAMAADLKVMVGTRQERCSGTVTNEVGWAPPTTAASGAASVGGAHPTPLGLSSCERIDEAITLRVPNTLFVNDDLDAILALRQAARDKGDLAAEIFTGATALPVKRVIVLLPYDCDARVVGEWHKFAADLQRHIRVAVLSLPHRWAANLRGAIEVMTWQTGLSCATGGVDFADGSPRPCAGAVALLPRGACDAVIDTGWAPMPAKWSKHVKHRIRIGPGSDDAAAVNFITPGLTLGLAARVMRFDGAILWLCDDPAAAPPDPTLALLRALAT